VHGCAEPCTAAPLGFSTNPRVFRAGLNVALLPRVTPFAQGIVVGVIVNAIVFAIAIILSSRPRAPIVQRTDNHWP
jgi:hypothetical protein